MRSARAKVLHPLCGRPMVAWAVEAAASLDHISGGRLNLGIGAGWFEKEHVDLGFDFGTFTDRFEKLEEALRIIGPMLRGERPTLEGEHYRVREAINSPPPMESSISRCASKLRPGRRVVDFTRR